MDEFFPKDPKEGQGYQGGSDKNRHDIEKVIRPILNILGYDCRLEKDDGTSNRMLIFHKSNPHVWIKAKMVIIKDVKSISTRANSNIQDYVVDGTREEDRVHWQWTFLKQEEVFLFMYAKRGGFFLLVPYGDIPEEHYRLTYRDTPDRKNRIWIVADALPPFKRNLLLLQELQRLIKP